MTEKVGPTVTRFIRRKMREWAQKWGVEECDPGTTAGGVVIDAECFLVAQFWTMWGAERWMRRNRSEGHRLVTWTHGEWITI